MGMNLGTIKIDLGKVFSKIRHLFSGKNRLWLFLIFLALLGHFTYQWQRYVSSSGWKEERKQEYINKKEKPEAFDSAKFDKVVSEIENRDKEYQNKLENVPDIFKLK